jgi:hypothetical protein
LLLHSAAAAGQIDLRLDGKPIKPAAILYVDKMPLHCRISCLHSPVVTMATLPYVMLQRLVHGGIHPFHLRGDPHFLPQSKRHGPRSHRSPSAGCRSQTQTAAANIEFPAKISHVHVKDISVSLAAEPHAEMTGIASSHCATGDGVNAGNIRKCVELLTGYGYRGVLTIECEAQHGMMEASVAWMNGLIADMTHSHSSTFRHE